MRILCVLVALVWIAPAMAHEVSVGEGGITFAVEGSNVPLIKGMRYEARDADGPVFRTESATLSQEGQVTFDLSGAGAADAKVGARLTRLSRGFRLDWTIEYSGPERSWDPWNSGFRYEFGRPIVDAAARPVTRWVKPTGAHPWEVPGDTLYPDTECQIRRVMFGDAELVMVSSSYDPDWIYGRKIGRARFGRFVLPKGSPVSATCSLVFLGIKDDVPSSAELAAEAAGRPVAMALGTGRVGNLFRPGEQIGYLARFSNVTDRPQKARVDLVARNYDGELLLRDTRQLELSARARTVVDNYISPTRRGIVFLDAILSWDGGQQTTRTTFGILPERPADAPRPESPFGMAAIVANPDRYPDQFEMAKVLPLMQRIGVRWIRSGWFPLKDDITAEDERVTRERSELLRGHGILPHVQLGASVPEDDGLEAYKQRLASSLERFKWVSDYIEVGNELNYSATGTRYVEQMLRPTHEIMRRVHPGGKIMSMGLGGVTKEWLGEFVQAGGMDLVDVLSVHPGCHPRAPEFWEGWRGWVFRPQMLDAAKAAREHGGKQVWITEAYAPTAPQRSQLDLRSAADYLVRNYVCAMALGVQVDEWYQFQDGVWFAQRPRPDDLEYNFGIVYTDLTPKPAYIAYGVMTEQLEGARYAGRLDLGADDLYGVRFMKDGARIDVLYSYREKHETDIAWWPPEKFKDDSRKPGEPWVERWREPVTVELAAAGQVQVIDIMGNTRTVAPRDGKVSLALNGSPVYVHGLGPAPQQDTFWEDIP